MSQKQSVYMDYQGNDNKTKMIVDAANKNTSDILHKYVSFSKSEDPMMYDVCFDTKEGFIVDDIELNSNYRYADQSDIQVYYNGWEKTINSYGNVDVSAAYLLPIPSPGGSVTVTGRSMRYISFTVCMSDYLRRGVEYTINFKVSMVSSYLQKDDENKFGILIGNLRAPCKNISDGGDKYLDDAIENETFGQLYQDLILENVNSSDVIGLNATPHVSYQSFYRDDQEHEYSLKYTYFGEEELRLILLLDDNNDIPSQDWRYYHGDTFITVSDIKCNYIPNNYLNTGGSYVTSLNPAIYTPFHSNILFGLDTPNYLLGEDGDLYFKLSNPVVSTDTLDIDNLEITAPIDESYSEKTWKYNNDKTISQLGVSFSFTGYNLQTRVVTESLTVNETSNISFDVTGLSPYSMSLISFSLTFSSDPQIETRSSYLAYEGKYALYINHKEFQIYDETGPIYFTYMVPTNSDGIANISINLTPINNRKASEITCYVSDIIVSKTVKYSSIYFKHEGNWLFTTSSGGSEVIPNPSGTATDTLTKVEIDGDIYDIPSGGGSSYSETTLFTGTYQTTSGEITLSDDLDNYDQIIIWARWSVTTTNGTMPCFLNRREFVSRCPYNNGSTAQTTGHIVISYDNQYIRVKCGSTNSKLFLFDSRSIAIEKVIGVTF